MQVISEGPTKITKATIDAAWRRRIAGRRLIVRDKDCRGLALIVNQPGMTRSYAQSAPGGQSPNRTTLAKQGCHDWKPRHAFPPDDARTEANRLKREAAAGGDPAAERKARTEIERRNKGATLGRLADKYALALPRRSKLHGPGHPSPAPAGLGIDRRRRDACTGPNGGPCQALAERGQGGTHAPASVLCPGIWTWCPDTRQVGANVCTLVAPTRRPQSSPRPRALPDVRAAWPLMARFGAVTGTRLA